MLPNSPLLKTLHMYTDHTATIPRFWSEIDFWDIGDLAEVCAATTTIIFGLLPFDDVSIDTTIIVHKT